MTKAVKDSITSMQDTMFGKQSRGQATPRDMTPTVSGYWSTARRYAGNGFHSPGATEERVYKHFKDALTEVVDQINEFYAGKWLEFREAITEVDFDPFEDLEPIGNN